MTRQEATAIVAELAASYSGIRLSADRAKVYEDAILPLPTQQTYSAIREVMHSQERFPSVALLLHLIRASEASKRGEQPATYTGRATLKVSDVCIHCGRRITDQEFDEDNWRFVESGRDEVVGREHRCCYPKREAAHTEVPDRVPDDIQPAQFAADIPF